MAGIIAVAGLVLAGGGCPVRPSKPSPSPPPPPRAASSDAVLHEEISVQRGESETHYSGPGWTLSVDRAVGWQRVPDDPNSTLKLTRRLKSLRLDLTLEVYPVRSGMPVATFLAAHGMWMSEEGGPRVEYEYDDGSESWRGYAIYQDKEMYYAFWVAGNRAYVLGETATGGVLSGQEASRFRRTANAFHRRLEPATKAPPGSAKPESSEDS
jgi:hypothetical protein